MDRMAAAPSYFSDRFSIKDLELFSGIKAHTIRAWERRYALLEPARSKTNIRSYSTEDLRTLLNVSLLMKEGMSISQVAALSSAKREEKIRTMAGAGHGKDQALNELKMATVTYDEERFEATSRNYRVDHGFEALVENLYLPLLTMLGLLWQSATISPAQEHFASNLVRQKLISAIDSLPLGRNHDGPTVVLYLPENEIHELGLLYLHYRLRREGWRTLYLGESVPMADLVGVAREWPGPLAICAILTVHPRPPEVLPYLEDLAQRLPDVQFHFCGPALQPVEGRSLPECIHVHPDIAALVSALHPSSQ